MFVDEDEQAATGEESQPNRGRLLHLPVFAAILAKGSLNVLSLGFVGASGLLPDQVGHTEGAQRGHGSCGVVHVAAKASAVRGGASALLYEANLDVCAIAARTIHEKIPFQLSQGEGIPR